MSKSFKKVTQRNRRKIVRKKEERRYEAYSMDLVSNVNDPGVQLLYHGGIDHEKKQKQLQALKDAKRQLLDEENTIY